MASALMPFLGQLAVCSTMLLEQGWSAMSTAHYELMMDRDFDLIAEAEPSFRHAWIVPRGSLA